MIRATVVGEVWATRKAPGLNGRKLLLLSIASGGDAGTARNDRLVVAIDTLDAGPGDSVLVSWGSGARNVLRPGPDNHDLLCDAAVSLVIDGDSTEEGP